MFKPGIFFFWGGGGWGSRRRHSIGLYINIYKDVQIALILTKKSHECPFYFCPFYCIYTIKAKQPAFPLAKLEWTPMAFPRQYQTSFLGNVSVGQLVASMSGVVQDGVVEVVGSNLARCKIFTASIRSAVLLYPSVSDIG